jgi:hypothetical protein
MIKREHSRKMSKQVLSNNDFLPPYSVVDPYLDNTGSFTKAVNNFPDFMIKLNKGHHYQKNSHNPYREYDLHTISGSGKKIIYDIYDPQKKYYLELVLEFNHPKMSEGEADFFNCSFEVNVYLEANKYPLDKIDCRIINDTLPIQLPLFSDIHMKPIDDHYINYFIRKYQSNPEFAHKIDEQLSFANQYIK